MRWGFVDSTRFTGGLGEMIVRTEEGGKVRLRAFPERRHSNLANRVHGGALLGFIDVCLFATARSHGLIDPGAAMTIDLSTQFIGGPAIDRPLDFVSEILRETRRLIFIRGLVEQDGEVMASYAGTIRKPTVR